LTNFLIQATSHQITFQVIFDGIKPKALQNTVDEESKEMLNLNPLYSYSNFGAVELVKVIKLLRNANYMHSYMFAPYEATAQIYYLHDNYMASSI